jgi:predicted NUDIX family NTP pyrophosphohydrolase
LPPLSAGILLYRQRSDGPQILLIHPGGPFWRNKDEGAWMIPKGMVEPGEEEAAAALREFEEELGTRPAGTLQPLCRIRQKGGKWVQTFLLEGDFDPETLVSNMTSVEWPPKSGRLHNFPEVDRAAWFALAEARVKILPSQEPIIDAFEAFSPDRNDR